MFVENSAIVYLFGPIYSFYLLSPLVILVWDICVTTFSSWGVNNFQGLLRIVDIPGHERLRGKFFDEYKQAAKGIVYIIDSVTAQKDIQDVAE